MARKEDIGKLIKRQFEGIEKSPGNSLWEKIDSTLQKRRKKKGTFLLLVLLGLFIAVNSFWFWDNFSRQNDLDLKFDTNKIINEKSSPRPETESNHSIKRANSSIPEDKIDEEQKPKEKVTPGHLKDKDNLSKTQKTSQTRKDASKSEKFDFKPNQDEAATYNQLTHIQNTATEVDSINIPFIEPDIAEVTPEQKSDSILVEEDEKKPNELETNQLSKKWAVTVLGGINTYNSFNKSSLIHPSLNDFNRSGTLDYTYGFALRFDLTDNLAISYGINKTTFSYFTKNIPSSNETEINRILSYTHWGSGQTISSSELSNFLQDESQADLLHQTEYIELPFIIRYSLSSKRFGIHTLGGISSYLHNKENLYVQKENGDKLKIGSLNNLTGVRFSFNLGVGLYYEISENLLIELNPTFKYGLSKFSSSADGDKPYFIGVSTGLTYKIF